MKHKTICTTTQGIRTTPAPTAPTPALVALVPIPHAPARVVALQSHLDPSFVQSPTNPLAVTYAYSASATVGSEVESSLPEGFLNLYSDGLLRCSMNVGGSIAGGECLVTYSTTGAHSVIVTYTAGSASGTETYTEDIEPFATTTTVGYFYEPEDGELSVSAETTGPGGGTPPSGRYRLALVNVVTGTETLLENRCAHGTAPEEEGSVRQLTAPPFVLDVRPAVAVEPSELAEIESHGDYELYPAEGGTGQNGVAGCTYGTEPIYGPLVEPSSLEAGEIVARVTYTGTLGWEGSRGTESIVVTP